MALTYSLLLARRTISIISLKGGVGNESESPNRRSSGELKGSMSRERLFITTLHITHCGKLLCHLLVFSARFPSLRLAMCMHNSGLFLTGKELQVVWLVLIIFQ